MAPDGYRDDMVGKVPGILTHLLGASKDICIQSDARTGPDLVITTNGKTFVIEFWQSTGAATIAAAARQLLAYGKQAAKRVVLLVGLSCIPMSHSLNVSSLGPSIWGKALSAALSLVWRKRATLFARTDRQSERRTPHFSWMHGRNATSFPDI